MTFPALTLAEAEDQLADAKVQLDAEAERSVTGGEPAYLQAEDAWIAASRRAESVRSQQPQHGRGYWDEVAL